MKYTDFVIQYKKSKEQEAFVTKHVKKSYMPYAEKLALAKSIANRTSWNEDGKYERNTTLQAWLLQTNMISYYTDITWEDTEVIQAYDSLVESGAFELIFSYIPESERVQLQAITDMFISDIYTNFRDIPAWLDSKIEALDLGLGSIMSGLQQVMEDKPDLAKKILQMPTGNSEE